MLQHPWRKWASRIGSHRNVSNSWSQMTDSVPVKSVIEAESETASDVVVLTVVTVPR
jgi:hypothetical protein